MYYGGFQNREYTRAEKCKAELTRIMQAMPAGQTIDSRFDVRSKCCEPEDRPAACVHGKETTNFIFCTLFKIRAFPS